MIGNFCSRKNGQKYTSKREEQAIFLFFISVTMCIQESFSPPKKLSFSGKEGDRFIALFYGGWRCFSLKLPNFGPRQLPNLRAVFATKLVLNVLCTGKKLSPKKEGPISLKIAM